MAKAAKKTRIAAAVGTATAGGSDLHFSVIEKAMTDAAQDCFDRGITDPDKVRDAKLAARERVKREHRQAQAKAAREAREAAKS